MILWILKQTIISLIIIVLVHYIYIYLKTNLTIPKTRDLIHRPSIKYKEIYKSIDEHILANKTLSTYKQESQDEINTQVKTTNNETMENELKDFFKNLSNVPVDTGATVFKQNVFLPKYETLS